MTGTYHWTLLPCQILWSFRGLGFLDRSVLKFWVQNFWRARLLCHLKCLLKIRMVLMVIAIWAHFCIRLPLIGFKNFSSKTWQRDLLSWRISWQLVFNLISFLNDFCSSGIICFIVILFYVLQWNRLFVEVFSWNKTDDLFFSQRSACVCCWVTICQIQRDNC